MPGFFVFTFTSVDAMMSHILFAVLLVAMVAYSINRKKLTPVGAATGAAVAICIYAGAGLTGVIMLGAFFILGTGATAWRHNKKNTISASFTQRRTASQVLANSSVAALCGLLALVFPQHRSLFSIMMAAGISTATADTLSSELGTIYGSRFINIITLKKDIRGLDGVISLEGLLIGVFGSCIIAFVFVAGTHPYYYAFIIIILAGTFGNLADSILGAVMERKGLLKNDAVNFLATAIGAIIAGILVAI